MTPKNFRTYNPWGHVSKADRMNRLQIVREMSDKVNGKTWRVWERPEGSEDETLKHTFTRYTPRLWRSVFRGGMASEQEARDRLMAYIGWSGVEEIDGEIRKNGMRYVIANEAEE